jgi:alginate O-acetyltransferase complex protein AlgI
VEAIVRLPRRGGALGTGRPTLSAGCDPPKDDTPMGLLTFAFFSFFAAVCLAYWVVPARWRSWLLLGASLAFYAIWNARLLALLLGATVINHLLLRRLKQDGSHRLAVLRLGIVIQCALLFTFKYFAFFVDSAATLFALANVHFEPLVLQLVVPLGLSYYCLRAIALLADTYRGQYDGSLSLQEHAIYLLFFPSVTAGPIDRPRQFLDQIRAAGGPGWRTAVPRGADLLFVGLLKKAVIANGLAPVVDRVFTGTFTSTGAASMAAVTYALYIYADFSGYTDIARGAAACMGIDLTMNFRRPYAARSTSEFWQRWHMSLSTWLRDYVFLPLGGAFHSPMRAYANLLITMLIAGLWHGASFMFVLWGLYIGLLLVAHRALQPSLRKLRRTLRLRGWTRRVAETGLTFTLISAGWLLFRGTSLGQTVSAFHGGMATLADWADFARQVMPYGVALFGLDLVIGDGEAILLRGSRLPWWTKPILVAVGVYAFLILGSDTQSFVYAQF